MKSTIYNLIILDESGSMSCVRNQTISGCNETINTIRAAQKKYAETQDHFVSIFAFQSGGDRPSRYIIKNEPIDRVEHITSNQYDPDGCTPLYDAVGGTLTDLKATTKGNPLAIGSVTIITDGMENSSEHYDREKVARMIDALKEMGWSFNFIGANIDVKSTAQSLHIDNSLEFQQDAKGTTAMFAKESRSRMGWFGRSHNIMASMKLRIGGKELSNDDLDAFHADMEKASADYFDEDRGEDLV